MQGPACHPCPAYALPAFNQNSTAAFSPNGNQLELSYTVACIEFFFNHDLLFRTSGTLYPLGAMFPFKQQQQQKKSLKATLKSKQ